jgi:hypothetical protein
MPAIENLEFAVEVAPLSNDKAVQLVPCGTLTDRIEKLKALIRRHPQTSAGVLAYWLRGENS